MTTDDPSVRRLFPTAYHEDPERDREYQQLVRDELLERRLAALATVEATAEADELDEEELTALAHRAQRPPTGAGHPPRRRRRTRTTSTRTTPTRRRWRVYGYLSVLLADVVDALAEDLPPPTEPEM